MNTNGAPEPIAKFPKLSPRDNSKKHLMQKGFAALIEKASACIHAAFKCSGRSASNLPEQQNVSPDQAHSPSAELPDAWDVMEPDYDEFYVDDDRCDCGVRDNVHSYQCGMDINFIDDLVEHDLRAFEDRS